MIGTPTRIYLRRVGSAVLSASIVAVLLISAGVAAGLILFAPAASAKTASTTVNAEYSARIDSRSVEVDLI